MEDNQISHFIENLQAELKWKILSYLPYNILSKLGLSNKEAWMIFNMRGQCSEKWNTEVNWITKLNRVNLTVSESLFLFTLSDLHNHMTAQDIEHECVCFKVAEKSQFQLFPLPHLDGFVLKNDLCTKVPWSELVYELNSRTECQQSSIFHGTYHDGEIPPLSSVYTFFVRELTKDSHVNKFFDKHREENSTYFDGECFSCSSCNEEETSEDEFDDDSDMSYSQSMVSVESVASCLESEVEIGIEELTSLKEVTLNYISEYEKERFKRHRDKISKSIEKEKDSQKFIEEGGCKKKKKKKNVFCHYYNNYGSCGFQSSGSDCEYLHELAPVCRYDLNCTHTKCGFYHNPKPDLTVEKILAHANALGTDVITDAKKNDDQIDCVNDENNASVIEETVSMMDTIINKDYDGDVDDDYDDDDDDDYEDTKNDEKDSLLWKEFASDFKLRSRFEFLDDENQKAKEKKINKGIPDYNSFPVLFFLALHPLKIENVNLVNKKVVENCVAWDVYEQGYDNSDGKTLLGLAIMPLTSEGVPELPICLGDQAAAGVFGVSNLLGIGVYNPCKEAGQCMETRPSYMNYHLRVL